MNYQVELLEEALNFILSLPVKMQAKVFRTIELLEEFGYELPEPHSKKLTGQYRNFLSVPLFLSRII